MDLMDYLILGVSLDSFYPEWSLFFLARQQPFRVGVNIDNTEVHTAATADMAQLGEQSRFPGGIIGFKLTYFQRAC